MIEHLPAHGGGRTLRLYYEVQFRKTMLDFFRKIQSPLRSDWPHSPKIRFNLESHQQEQKIKH